MSGAWCLFDLRLRSRPLILTLYNAACIALINSHEHQRRGRLYLISRGRLHQDVCVSYFSPPAPVPLFTPWRPPSFPPRRHNPFVPSAQKHVYKAFLILPSDVAPPPSFAHLQPSRMGLSSASSSLSFVEISSLSLSPPKSPSCVTRA